MPLASKKKLEKIEEELILPSHYILVAADLSLRRPGFAQFNILKTDDKIDIIQMSTFKVDNKTKTKTRGQILKEISSFFKNTFSEIKLPVYFVREKSVNNFMGKGSCSSASAKSGVQAVVGIMDLMAWDEFSKEWEEIYPVTVKKLITGNGKADKQQVAKALDDYIGKRTYECDDESDAAAVGVAWMINHKQMKQITQEDQPNE